MDYPKKGHYRHFKGGEYELLYIARHSETDEEMVVYRALYECGKTPLNERIWVRPLKMWLETVTRDGVTRPRFEYIGDEKEKIENYSEIEQLQTEYDRFYEQAQYDYYADAAPLDLPQYDAAIDENENRAQPREICAEPEDILSSVFGYGEFRPAQKEIIDAIISGRDLLGVMPTGAGKSLCYQVPALALNGVTIVVSPLISLMKDQVSQLKQAGVAAAYINSSLSLRQQEIALQNAANGDYKIIYIAPERLLTNGFLSACARMDIALVAVDEAHCISQWGQDFRPSYLDIPQFIERLSRRPRLCAFTATATKAVRQDIIRLLKMRSPEIRISGFDRENLYYRLIKGGSKKAQLLKLMRSFEDMSGIIYCATRKSVDEVYALLSDEGYEVTRYHAGLDETERRLNQDAFTMDEKPIMVATNAFGMGIDKSNVRFVIHYQMPKDMESYYQEAGRAGRDGMRAVCALMYSTQDIYTQKYFIQHLGEEAGIGGEELKQLKRAAQTRLNAMIDYASGDGCLRAKLLKYFGETANVKCSGCDVCDGRIDDSAEAAAEEKSGKRKKSDANRFVSSEDSRLFERLKRLRLDIARQRGVPPFVIFSDATLHIMATLKPRSKEEFLRVSGVGQAKCRDFADVFLACIGEGGSEG